MCGGIQRKLAATDVYSISNYMAFCGHKCSSSILIAATSFCSNFVRANSGFRKNVCRTYCTQRDKCVDKVVSAEKIFSSLFMFGLYCDLILWKVGFYLVENDTLLCVESVANCFLPICYFEFYTDWTTRKKNASNKKSSMAYGICPLFVLVDLSVVSIRL